MVLVIHLFGVEVVFKHAVVEIDGCELFQFLWKLAADVVYHVLEELLDQLKVVYKDLQEVFNPYLLIRF